MTKAQTKLPDQPVILSGKKKLLKKIWDYREMYAFLFLAVLTTLIFSYGTMYGQIMAFQNVRLGDIIGQAEWVGLYQFDLFFNGLWFDTVLWNTMKYAIAGNLCYWPAALALALMLHNCTRSGLKKAAQNLTYIPHLLSLIVVFSIVDLFINHHYGLINILLTQITGVESNLNFYLMENAILPLYLIIGIWQSTGNSAIIYIATLSSVDEEMTEAARIDGCNKWHLIWDIQIPTIMPTIVTLLIMNMASLFAVGTEKLLLMQNDLNLRQTEVIGTYTYKLTVTQARYGFTTAVGFFQNIINLVMMFIINWLGDKLAGISVI